MSSWKPLLPLQVAGETAEPEAPAVASRVKSEDVPTSPKADLEVSPKSDPGTYRAAERNEEDADGSQESPGR
uniref:Uncharacterized protein n=1 Tax=Steinernema glaseri TaxID=37863 RepID=A0A1I7Y589_9BILA